MKSFLSNIMVSVLILISLTLGACNKKNVVPKNVVTNIKGTYSYTLKLYSVSDDSLRYLGINNDKTGVFVLKNNVLDLTKIDFWEVKGLLFQGNQLSKLGDYITFKIPSQKYDELGRMMGIQGYEGVLIGATKHQAVYSILDKKIKGYFKIEGSSIIVSVEAYKFPDYNNQILFLNSRDFLIELVNFRWRELEV